MRQHARSLTAQSKLWTSVVLCILFVTGCSPRYSPYSQEELKKVASQLIYPGSHLDAIRTQPTRFSYNLEIVEVEFELPKGITYGEYLSKTLPSWKNKGWKQTSTDFYSPTKENVSKYLKTSLSNSRNDSVIFLPYANDKDLYQKTLLKSWVSNGIYYQIGLGKHGGLVLRVMLYIDNSQTSTTNVPALNEILP